MEGSGFRGEGFRVQGLGVKGLACREEVDGGNLSQIRIPKIRQRPLPRVSRKATSLHPPS